MIATIKGNHRVTEVAECISQQPLEGNLEKLCFWGTILKTTGH
jgi:hypothetical protein